jgi:hypothetical protein
LDAQPDVTHVEESALVEPLIPELQLVVAFEVLHHLDMAEKNRDGNLHPWDRSPTGLAPIGCGCGSGFTPMVAPALDPGWQRAWVWVSIRTHGFPLGTRLQPMYYNFGSQNPRAPETRPETHGHSMAFPPTGAGFHPSTF